MSTVFRCTSLAIYYLLSFSGNWNASTSANFCMSTVFRCTVLAMYHLLLLWVTSPSAMGNQPHLLLLWVTSPFAMGSQPHSYALKQVIALKQIIALYSALCHNNEFIPHCHG